MAKPVDLADRLFDGKLADWLFRARRDGKAYDEISRELHERGVSVSRETVRRWCRDRDGMDVEARVEAWRKKQQKVGATA